jgi:8-oxo-dGTP pyrophosphatase MutT (NUDIX family)
MNLEAAYRESLQELGYDLDDIYNLDDESRKHYVKNCVSNG